MTISALEWLYVNSILSHVKRIENVCHVTPPVETRNVVIGKVHVTSCKQPHIYGKKQYWV